ncbi:ATP-binding protein [Pseudofrankia saprophytica]|uniref:ATP-binding protein n=1 Tax=Pseudofrankia saprophytica TaxID=298655 RepID=UPI000234C228|nr:ATP-binding protein [Pseudofrankia saprophytica]
MPARALDTFSAVYFRGLAVLRALVVLFTVSYVGIWWRDWYGQRPGGLVGPALVVAWSLVYIAVTARRALPRALVLVDVAIGIAVGLTAPWTVPDASLGDPSSWVLLTVVFAALSAVCALRTRFSLVAILALACAHFIPAHDHRPQVVTSTGLLLFIGLALRQGVVRIRRVALDADAWLDAVGARSRAELVAAARARSARSSERFLHDTVLNMLAGIGLGGVGDAGVGGGAGGETAGTSSGEAGLARARARCRRVVAQVEQLLASSGSTADAPGDSDGELDRQVRAVAEEAVDDGLDVTLTFTRVDDRRWPLPARRARDAEPAGPAAELLPTDVVNALAAAMREALTNIRRHAGVGAARVSVNRWRDGVRVEIEDDGVGFDAVRYDPAATRTAAAVPAGDGPDEEAHLGVSGSVHGRMADVGGWAGIESVPGQGTRVELDWQAPRPVPAGSADGADLRRDYERAIRRAVGVALLAGVVVLALPAVAFRAHSEPSLDLLAPIASYASLLLWVVVAGGALRIAAVTWWRPLTGVESLTALGFIVAIVLAGAATTSGTDVIRIYDWAGILAPTVLLLPITVSRPARQWVAAVTVVLAVALAVSLPRIGTAPLELIRMLGTLYGISTVQLLVTTAGPVLRATADATTRAAHLEAELGAHQEAAAVVRRDRARRLARLNGDVLPLLRAVADGSADPRDEQVRRLCANRARALRRMLSGSGGRAGPLAELETAIDAAEARGATVNLQVAGEFADIPYEVRDELVDLLSETLRVAPPGRVTVTLMCDGRTGDGYISYPAVSYPVVILAGAGTAAGAPSRSTVPDGQAASGGPGTTSSVAILDGAAPPDEVVPLDGTGWPRTCALVTRVELDEDSTIVELAWPAPASAG